MNHQLDVESNKAHKLDGSKNKGVQIKNGTQTKRNKTETGRTTDQ